MLHALPLASLIERHARLVRAVLRRRGVAERDLPDAQQEVFLVAHRRLPTFEGRSSLATWLARIAFHIASQHRRLARNRYEALVAEPICVDAEGDPHAQLERREALLRAQRALCHLREEQREAVLLHASGLSMREVAARLGVPLKTAFSRTYAARRRLAATLAEGGSRRGLAWLAWLLPAAWAGRAQALVRSWTPSGAQLAQVAVSAVLACLASPPSMLPLDGPVVVPMVEARALPAGSGSTLDPSTPGSARPATIDALPQHLTAPRDGKRERPRALPKAPHASPRPADTALALGFDDMDVTRAGTLDPRPSLPNPLEDRLGPTRTVLRGRLLGPGEGGAIDDTRLAAWALP